MVEKGQWLMGRGVLAEVKSAGKIRTKLRQFGEDHNYEKNTQDIVDLIKDNRLKVVSAGSTEWRDGARLTQYALIPDIVAQMERLHLSSIRIDERVIHAYDREGNGLCVGRGDEGV